MAKSKGGGRGHRAPAIVAHRGASREAPENTRAALDRALRRGVDGIEVDLQLTADDVPVLYHDRTLTRVGGGRRRIADLSLRQLRTLDFGSWFDPSFAGEPLLTLDTVLRRYGDRTPLYLEIKSRPGDRARGRQLVLTEEVVAAVDRLLPSRRRDSLTILSFDPLVLERASAIAPDLTYIYNIDSPPSFTRRRRPRGVALAGCCLPVAAVTPSFVHRTRGENLCVLTYSCNVPRQARAALQAGVDVLLTDDPRWLSAYLRRRCASR